jgi:hypothetical protein
MNQFSKTLEFTFSSIFILGELLSLVVLVNEEWKAKLLQLRGVELLENLS